jgi:hypothetical protein
MRGLAEKIWNVFAPSRCVVIAASSSDFEPDLWIPIRRNGYRSRRGDVTHCEVDFSTIHPYIMFSSEMRWRVSAARQA